MRQARHYSFHTIPGIFPFLRTSESQDFFKFPTISDLSANPSHLHCCDSPWLAGEPNKHRQSRVFARGMVLLRETIDVYSISFPGKETMSKRVQLAYLYYVRKRKATVVEGCRGLVFGKVGASTVKRCCKPAKFPVYRPKDAVRRIPLPLVAMHRPASSMLHSNLQ